LKYISDVYKTTSSIEIIAGNNEFEILFVKFSLLGDLRNATNSLLEIEDICFVQTFTDELVAAIQFDFPKNERPKHIYGKRFHDILV